MTAPPGSLQHTRYYGIVDRSCATRRPRWCYASKEGSLSFRALWWCAILDPSGELDFTGKDAEWARDEWERVRKYELGLRELARKLCVKTRRSDSKLRLEKQSESKVWWLCGHVGGDTPLPGTGRCRTKESALASALRWVERERSDEDQK